ncbi:MAG: homogentisate phytyltransferase [Leptolyngbyaceae bacterium]|nr:homogentisate phytyltransferase [Leptolyngbyaceae bacterium]
MPTSHPPSSTVQSSSSPPWVQRHLPWLYAFWKFSRPHTIVGTTLSVFSLAVMAIAIGSTPLPGFLASLWGIVAAWLTCLCGNVYIVGLNQLYDVKIDRMNKPHLPIASGEFSQRVGWIIVLLMGIVALATAPLQSPFLTGTVWLSVAIGTAYSLPPIRLKRFSFWASVCIFTVRGVIVNVGLFLHFRALFNQPPVVTPAVWALTLFILVFTFAIAIFKDIPDLEGDRYYNITTFTVKLGPKAVFDLSRWVLTVCYGGLMVASFWLLSVNTWVILGAHGLAITAVWVFSQRVDLREKRSIAWFYQFIWKLFFLEYILFPIACLFA